MATERNDLTLALNSVFSHNGYGRGRLKALRRKPTPYITTFPCEIVTCRFVDGGQLLLFCKYGARDGPCSYGQRGGVAYEAEVYRQILQPSGVSTPVFYGCYTEPNTGGVWLILEYLKSSLRAGKVSGLRAMKLAARWIGEFHAANEALAAEASRSFFSRPTVCKTVIAVLLCFFVMGVKAQSLVQGTVSSAESPLAGATVSLKGTNISTSTDASGHFQINAPNKGILVISFIGYTSKEVEIRGSSPLSILLENGSAQLNDIVVVGYGTQRKSDVTGSVSSVKLRDIEKTPSSRIDDALQGRLQKMSLDALQRETGLSRHTILRARQGKPVYPRTLQILKAAVSTAPIRKR